MQISNNSSVKQCQELPFFRSAIIEAWIAVRPADLPHFLAFESLKPFIDKHLGDLQTIVVKYRTEKGNIAHGIKAEIIPKICEIWMDAEEQGKLVNSRGLLR